MNAQEMSLAAGVVLSLLFSYAPGLAPRYAAFDPVRKSLVMLIILAAVALGTFGVSCGGLMALVACDKPGAVALFTNFISALIANQATFLISPQPGSPTTAPMPFMPSTGGPAVTRTIPVVPPAVEPKAPGVESHL